MILHTSRFGLVTTRKFIPLVFSQLLPNLFMLNISPLISYKARREVTSQSTLLAFTAPLVYKKIILLCAFLYSVSECWNEQLTNNCSITLLSTITDFPKTLSPKVTKKHKSVPIPILSPTHSQLNINIRPQMC